MDPRNLFMTRTTYLLVRLEYTAALGVAVVLAFMHLGEIRWLPFVGLFAYIDVIGYIPGAIAWHRAGGRLETRAYHLLYNLMHSFVSAGVVAAVWCLTVGPEWALLALPIHLCGDRGLLGNFLKPFGLSFEPQTHPAYQEFVDRYEHARGIPPVDHDHAGRAPVGAGV
ncbi:MAG: hypothetical protein QOE93_264 [Actinomycetota bacterium]|jgi:hypothetical protein|nr:hypothetical protein [Actinomycetota bacterium]